MQSSNAIVLNNITIEELEIFWGELTTEKKYLSDLINSNLQFVVGIRQDGELAGIGGIRKSFGIFYSSFRVVKNKFQRRGLSDLLFVEILNYASQKSYSYILSSIARENTPSINMALKSGYKIIYKSKKYYRFILSLNKKGKVLAHIFPFIYWLLSILMRMKD